MTEGIIIKALSGFYYVKTENGILECKARGRFRQDGTSPLVGDRALCSVDTGGKGRVDQILPRRNYFIRPAVANVDAVVFVAANTNPVTDPFLIDRVSVIAAEAGCELIVCINKMDIDKAMKLKEIYSHTDFTVVSTSTETGEGIERLRDALRGKICVFTGNSGVGKSSILNALHPGLDIETGEVSEKLGRGRHTTRHIEIYPLDDNIFAADTPGFASFDLEMMEPISKEKLQYDFIEFGDYIGKCRFNDCTHREEPDCAIARAVKDGQISESRHRSYMRLYELSAQRKSWEKKQN